MNMYNRSLFIFRQDLRTRDNTALIEAMWNSKEVFPIFIHDTRSIDEFGMGDRRFGFIREALESIDSELQKYSGRLTVYQWKPEEIVEELIEKYQIDAVFVNRSYSPRGKSRDEAIMSYCDGHEVDYNSYQDFLLVEPHECEQRKVFTPYSILWKKFLIAHPERLEVQEFDGNRAKWFTPENRKEISEIITVPYHKYWTLALGRERMDRDFSHYDELRNLPAVDGSTRLSPYIRFGVFSIREIYQKLVPVIAKTHLHEVLEVPLGYEAILPLENRNKFASQARNDETQIHSETLLNELIWREFWYQIGYYFPFTYELEFQERRRSIVWKIDTNTYEYEKFEKWETWYPLVDAAIQQLIETNWMHNRLRMVVASFLTKNLGYDWRIGEKFFKKYLIDYDEAVNYGNWQWSASVGADPKPVRIFNPLLQSEKFDTDCKFIKKYIPELEWVSPTDIHTLNLSGRYHRPIVWQKESAAEARERYRTDLV